jgi:hypothetical protein
LRRKTTIDKQLRGGVFIISATATVAVEVTATTAVAGSITRAATVAAAGDQKEYDNEKPDHIVVIENIAKTIHKYPPFAAQDGDFIKK